MKLKSVSWSYPTSPNAKQFGFNNSGCWTVETSVGNEPSVAVAGYSEKAEAFKLAESMPLKWSKYTVKL